MCRQCNLFIIILMWEKIVSIEPYAALKSLNHSPCIFLLLPFQPLSLPMSNWERWDCLLELYTFSVQEVICEGSHSELGVQTTSGNN